VNNVGTQNSFQFLTSCGGGDFVCGDNQTVCTADPSFVLHSLQPGPIRQINITGNLAHPFNTTSPISSDSNSTSNSTQTTSAPPSGNHEVAVGLGVGIPLAVAFVLAISWAFWERSKRQRVARNVAAGPAEIDGPSVGYSDTKFKQQIPGELGDHSPHELQ
jgi:hypothetical protein